jgi:GNAT superfamily N-acetyltransferase
MDDTIHILPLSAVWKKQTRLLLDSIFAVGDSTLYTTLSDPAYIALYEPSPTYLQYYIAIDTKSNQVVGTSGLYAYAEEDSMNVLSLGWFCVRPSFRGQGIATALLAHALVQAASMGREKVRLWTTDEPQNAHALDMFSRSGFVVTKRTNGRFGTIVTMERAVDKI